MDKRNTSWSVYLRRPQTGRILMRPQSLRLLFMQHSLRLFMFQNPRKIRCRWKNRSACRTIFDMQKIWVRQLHVIGENISFQIAEFARISGVTKVVIGRSNTRRYHFWDKQTVTEQLISIAPNIDIYIIPDSKANIKENQRKRFAQQIIPTGKDILITAGMLFAMTLLSLAFSRLGFTESNIITVYILGVLLNAILTRSHFCSLISSFCSVLFFNYYFTESTVYISCL